MESEKCCLSLYFPFLCFSFRAIAAIIVTMITNIMNSATQLSVDETEGLAAVVLVLETGGTGLVELETGPGFDVWPLDYSM
jgi:hypothetical protein